MELAVEGEGRNPNTIATQFFLLKSSLHTFVQRWGLQHPGKSFYSKNVNPGGPGVREMKG